MVETKWEVESQDPIPQLYGQLLAAARINEVCHPADFQTVLGCYTIAGSWTFVRAEVSNLEVERPTLQIEYSREYTEKIEAEVIEKYYCIVELH